MINAYNTDLTSLEQNMAKTNTEIENTKDLFKQRLLAVQMPSAYRAKYNSRKKSIGSAVRPVVFLRNLRKQLLCFNPFLRRDKAFVPADGNDPFLNRLSCHNL